MVSVKVKRSLLPSAGNGVFSTRAVSGGVRLTTYGGVVLPYHQADTSSPYVHSIEGGRVIQGDGQVYSTKQCGHIVNDYVSLTDRTPDAVKTYLAKSQQHANVCMKWEDAVLRVYSSRPLAAGEELYYHYGPRYWLLQMMHADVASNLMDQARLCEDRLVELENWPRRLPPEVHLDDSGNILHADGRDVTEEECRRVLVWRGMFYDVHNPREVLRSLLL